MTLRLPTQNPSSSSTAHTRAGTHKIFDLDDLALGALAAGQDHDVGIVGIQYIQAAEAPLAIVDLGSGNAYASGHAISLTAADQAGVGVIMAQGYSTIRFAYTWGAGNFSSITVALYDKDNGEYFDTMAVTKSGPAQWIEYKAPAGRTVRGFATYLGRYGNIDNISVF